MRNLPAMEAIWRSGEYVGDRRPTIRATIQHPHIALRTYGLMSTYSFITNPPKSGTASSSPIDGLIDPTHGRKVTNTYADLLFSNPAAPFEIGQIRSLTWTRSLDTDAGSMTMEIANIGYKAPSTLVPTHRRYVPDAHRDLDYPGYFTPTRGTSANAKRWGHTKNPWYGMLLPDNVIRTYEGYGVDFSKRPEKDPHLVQTGVWMIDTIKMNAFGDMTIVARDLARLLLDQQTNQPVIPKDFDGPLSFEDWLTDADVPTPTRTRVYLTGASSSNDYGPFKGEDGNYYPAVENGPQHPASAVLDDNPASYWRSFSHIRPNWRWATEWVQVNCKPATIDQLGVWLIGHGYTMYVSVYANGHWLNANGEAASDSDPTVPWQHNPESPPAPAYRDQQAVIPYVSQHVIPSSWDGYLNTATFDTPLPGVTAIRLSFRNLQRLPGTVKNYRVAVRQVRLDAAAGTSTTKLTPGPAGSNPGRYSDYTDIIKLCCAWAGLFWPSTAYQYLSDGTQPAQRFTKPDPVLGAVNGRVWGDFELTGTTGFVKIDDPLVNKSLMDVVTYVRNIIGFAFWLDEQGAAQWRLPNVYDAGNWVTDNSISTGRTNKMHSIDERQLLMELDSTLNSRNVFEYIRVSNLDPDTKEGIAATYNPNPIGLRRVGLWNEDKFTSAELQRAAEMTAAAALWLYRQDRVVIPGFPGIQVDDQVRIFERVTSEGNIHYVKGIQSSHNADTGEWTYTLDTQWLGDNPHTKWAIPMSQQPKAILDAVTKRRVRVQMRRDVDPVYRQAVRDTFG
jgi:hypothetical protein